MVRGFAYVLRCKMVCVTLRHFEHLDEEGLFSPMCSVGLTRLQRSQLTAYREILISRYLGGSQMLLKSQEDISLAYHLIKNKIDELLAISNHSFLHCQKQKLINITIWTHLRQRFLSERIKNTFFTLWAKNFWTLKYVFQLIISSLTQMNKQQPHNHLR